MCIQVTRRQPRQSSRMISSRHIPEPSSTAKMSLHVIRSYIIQCRVTNSVTVLNPATGECHPAAAGVWVMAEHHNPVAAGSSPLRADQHADRKRRGQVRTRLASCGIRKGASSPCDCRGCAWELRPHLGGQSMAEEGARACYIQRSPSPFFIALRITWRSTALNRGHSSARRPGGCRFLTRLWPGRRQ